MAMQVPTFTDALQQPKMDNLPSVRMSTSAPAAAFGADETARNVGQAAMGITKDIGDAFKEERDRADQLAHIQADTQASQTQTQIQTQVSKMKGQDALEAPGYAQKQWDAQVSKIQDGLVGQNQKLAFAHTSAQRWQDLNRSVEMHVAGEQEKFADDTYQAANDQARNAAVLNAGDDHQVSQNIDIQRQLMEGWAQRKGVPLDSPMFKDKLTAETSATHLGVIQARIEAGLDDGAQDYFTKNKDTMSAQDLIHAENILDASKVVGESNDLFNDILNKRGFKYSDGSVNGEAVRKYVMDETSDMSDQRKLKVLGQVKAQVAEYNRDRYHQVSANERSFANEVIDSRKNNQTLQDTMVLATKWGHDSYDIAQKQAFIQKTFEPPAETKVVAHEQLKEGIQNGSVELDDIDRALNHGDINHEDWANLRQQKLKVAADGTDPAMKYSNGLIKSMAQKAFGNDKEATAQFNYVLDKKTEGMTGDQRLAVAKDELGKVPPDGWWQRLFGTDYKYKKDVETIEGRDTAQGQMYQDIGFKQAQAVASGMTGGGFQRTTNPEANLQAFANTLGVGYNDMKIGTPINNAIQSLHTKGKIVTPDSVRKVLDKHPDGNWR